MRYALINSETNIVENCIVLGAGSNWPVPDRYFLIQSDTADIGSTWDGELFITNS